MKRFLILILTTLCLVLLLQPGRSQAEELQKIADSTESYYPLHGGNRWHYDVKVDQTPLKMTCTVAEVETINSETLFRIDTEINGQLQSSEHLKHTKTGFFRSRINGLPLEPPIQMLKSPILIGDSWETKTKIGPLVQLVKTKIVRTEKVSVPAGEFVAVVSHVATDVDGAKVISDYWLAAGVGIVKQEMQIGDQRITSKLRDYELVTSKDDSPSPQP